jgi:hypothetical protein
LQRVANSSAILQVLLGIERLPYIPLMPYIPLILFAWMLLCPDTAQKWLTRFGATILLIAIGMFGAIVLAGL